MMKRKIFIEGDEIGIMKVLEMLKEAYDNKIIKNFGFIVAEEEK